jgi:hypothetical protein
MVQYEGLTLIKFGCANPNSVARFGLGPPAVTRGAAARSGTTA